MSIALPNTIESGINFFVRFYNNYREKVVELYGELILNLSHYHLFMSGVIGDIISILTVEGL